MKNHELGEFIKIGDKEYEYDKEKRTIRRFNEKTKMWVNVIFASEDCKESEKALERFIEMLTDEHIRQCMEKIKGLRT
ncbi:hypothetical protein MKY42_11580 [Paenibacillus sp. FSL W7-1088]|uniref:hypothetical protein n=1 Tax=Paenibacillus sp. FSL W7-1088 TaxID=2921695 RepID=UPI0030EDDDD8